MVDPYKAGHFAVPAAAGTSGGQVQAGYGAQLDVVAEDGVDGREEIGVFG